jgi:hypothetical protein
MYDALSPLIQPDGGLQIEPDEGRGFEGTLQGSQRLACSSICSLDQAD